MLLPATGVTKSQIDDFENYMIQSLLESRNNASVTMLKRFHTDIIMRGITFKGIPGLRVIISQLAEPPTSVRQVSHPFRPQLLHSSGQALDQSLPLCYWPQCHRPKCHRPKCICNRPNSGIRLCLIYPRGSIPTPLFPFPMWPDLQRVLRLNSQKIYCLRKCFPIA